MGTESWNNSQPLMAIQLQTGEWLALHSSFIVIGNRVVRLTDVVGSGIGTVPVTSPATQPLTAIILGIKGGQRLTLIPAYVEYAQQFLDALYSLRPDLRPPIQPPPEGGPGGQPGTSQPTTTQALFQDTLSKAQDGLRATKPLLDGAVSKARDGLRAAKPLAQNAVSKAQDGLRATKPLTQNALAKAQDGLQATKPLIHNAGAAAKAGLAKLPDVQIQIGYPVQLDGQPAPAEDADVAAQPIDQPHGQPVMVPAVATTVAPITAQSAPAARPVAKVSVAIKPIHPPRPIHLPRPHINYSNLLAGFTHLTGLLMFLIVPMLVPLILWPTLADRMPFVSRHAKQAFFFQLLIFILLAIPGAAVFVIWLVASAAAPDFLGDFLGSLISSILKTLIPSVVQGQTGDTSSLVSLTITTAVVLFVLLLLVLLETTISFFYIVFASIRGFQGKPFHYPFLGRLWK